jgi:hypothetical protein
MLHIISRDSRRELFADLTDPCLADVVLSGKLSQRSATSTLHPNLLIALHKALPNA